MVVAHEWSHYFQAALSRNDEVGGTHRDFDLLDPRDAFGEGFATAFAGMLLGEHHYVDTKGLHQGQATPTDLDDDKNPNSSFYSEDAVIELLWDLYDHKEAELDAENGVIDLDDVELGFKPIVTQMLTTVRSSPAFTTIFSFLAGLLSDPVVAAAGTGPILALAANENIDLANFDQYEFFNTIAINGVNVGRLYVDVPPTGVTVEKYATGPFVNQFLQTRLTHDPPDPTGKRAGNRLYEYVFFKLNIAAAGNYRLEFRPQTASAFVDPSVFNRGQLVAGTWCTEEYLVHLQPGTYVGAIRGVGTDGKPKPTTFTIQVTPVP
jgi:hypothetical protein